MKGARMAKSVALAFSAAAAAAMFWFLCLWWPPLARVLPHSWQHVLGVNGHCHCGEVRPASFNLKTLASAEADFRANDRDGNGVNDFWRIDVSGLYTLAPKGTTEMIKLIDMSVAGADDIPEGTGNVGDMGIEIDVSSIISPGPKGGYWFRALRHADEAQTLDSNRFAFCAFPDSPTAGRWTYIVDEGNTVFKADLGPGARGPEVFPDEAGLKERWAKLD
jgi:hypothetical protein